MIICLHGQTLQSSSWNQKWLLMENQFCLNQGSQSRHKIGLTIAETITTAQSGLLLSNSHQASVRVSKTITDLDKCFNHKYAKKPFLNLKGQQKCFVTLWETGVRYIWTNFRYFVSNEWNFYTVCEKYFINKVFSKMKEKKKVSINSEVICHKSSVSDSLFGEEDMQNGKYLGFFCNI